MPTSTIHILVTKKTNRLRYIVSEVFERRLGLTPIILTDIEAFRMIESPKLNYSDHATAEGVLVIRPSGILFDKRVQAIETDVLYRPSAQRYLFPMDRHQLGFDPLAACFYLLSRYEEYLPHRKDDHGRYLSEQSIIVQQGWSLSPKVEEWIEELWGWLSEKYPALERKKHQFGVLVSVDVDQVFAIKAKGLVRSVFASGKDLVTGNVGQRWSVLSGRRKDPNDVYDRIIDQVGGSNASNIFFFQVGESTRFDVNNPPHLSAVRQRINEIALSSTIGLHPSYFSSDQPSKFFGEIERLRQIVSSGIYHSRQHYLRFQLPDTFRSLAEIGITDDYTIGFVDRNGFRAGTCKPFNLYDLEKDEILPVLEHPMAWMDLVASRVHPRDVEAWNELEALINAVKKYGGQLITTWHPEVLAESDEGYSTWGIFDRLISNA